MKNQMRLTHEFVEFIPDEVSEGVVYVSTKYSTVVHKCVCGCGNEVVTPLSPTGWQLVYDGVSISIYPSIGNWQFECRSHYWIRNDRVHWARRWSEKEIQAGRAFDQRAKEEFYSPKKSDAPPPNKQKTRKKSFWSKRSGG